MIAFQEATAKPSHLKAAELGTRAYWDACYARELANYADCPSDEGTVWFADTDAEGRMLSYLDGLAHDGRLVKGGCSPEDKGFCTDFLDLGTGNGHLLFSLRNAGWSGRMVGIDYSTGSVQLARRIAAQRQPRHQQEERANAQGAVDVRFEEWDIMGENPQPDCLQGGFDVVLDKGTFDAVSLSAEMDTRGRRVLEGYREQVEPLIKPGGLLLITSCNWTAGELRAWFASDGSLLEFEHSIEYPTITFGGIIGSQLCTLCFTKRVV